MDFAREIDDIGTFLTTRGFRFAIVGGVALAAATGGSTGSPSRSSDATID